MLKKIKKCSIFASSLNIVLYADSKLSRLNAAAAHESANSSCSVFFLIHAVTAWVLDHIDAASCGINFHRPCGIANVFW